MERELRFLAVLVVLTVNMNGQESSSFVTGTWQFASADINAFLIIFGFVLSFNTVLRSYNEVVLSKMSNMLNGLFCVLAELDVPFLVHTPSLADKRTIKGSDNLFWQ